MGHDRSYEIEDESNSRRDSDCRPPYSDYQAQRPGKLAGGQQWKVLQWNADRFVDESNRKRIPTDLANAGIRRHERERESNHKVRSMHLNDLLPTHFTIPGLRQKMAIVALGCADEEPAGFSGMNRSRLAKTGHDRPA